MHGVFIKDIDMRKEREVITDLRVQKRHCSKTLASKTWLGYTQTSSRGR
jgi:hypothetical protein